MIAREIVAGLVSTVIPVRNRPRMLGEAVESVLAQTYRPIEIVIVDDASTDETPSVIVSLEQRAPTVVRSIRRAQAGGPGVAREAGRRILRGEYVQYLDSDDLLFPRKFEQQVALHRERGPFALVYGDVEEHYLAPGRPARVDRRCLPVVTSGFPALLVTRLWQTCAPLYLRETVERAGPWLPLLNEEDWEYDARVAALGLPIAKLGEFVGTWRRHGMDHLSGGARRRRRALHHQARARQLTLGHAQRAGVARDAPEMQHAVRAVLLLSRQCGAAGLTADSKRLFDLARGLSLAPDAADLRWYAAAAGVMGWRPAGVLSGALDRLRAGWRR